MTAPTDKNLKKPRALTFEEAEEERMQHSLKKTVPERLEYLQRLRVLNYGEKANLPIVRKIQVLHGTKKRDGFSSCRIPAFYLHAGEAQSALLPDRRYCR